MLVKCVSKYINGDESWAKGHEEDVTDAHAEFLLRDSPGSFQVVATTAKEAKGSPADSDAEAEPPEPPEPDLSAMSTKNFGKDIPDRRARGGRQR